MIIFHEQHWFISWTVKTGLVIFTLMVNDMQEFGFFTHDVPDCI